MTRRNRKAGRPPQKPKETPPVAEWKIKNLPQDGNMALMGTQIAWLIENTYQFDIEANDERGCYQTVADYVEQDKARSPEHWLASWLGEDDVKKCVEANFMITVRCYPRGSVSFYSMHGSDLSRLVQGIYDAVRREIDPRPNEWRATA